MVVLVFCVVNIDEVINLVNNIFFGLGVSVWIKDMGEMERLILELEVGVVFINGLVKFDLCLFFGGIKCFGYGWELSREGILEFVNIKIVWVK